MAETPAYQDPIYSRWSSQLLQIEEIVSGSDTIKSRKENYLFKFGGESQTSFDNRVKLAEFNDTLKQTIDIASGKIFRKSLSYEDTPPEFEQVIDDADGTGINLNEWAKQFSQNGIEQGLAYIFVDFPSNPNAGANTIADDLANGFRPKFYPVRYSDIVNRVVGEDGELLQATIREMVTIQVSRFEQEQREQYRTLYISDGQVLMDVWVKDDSGNGGSYESQGVVITPYIGAKKLLKLPLIPFYTWKLVDHEARPPLYELSSLVIRWYNKKSQYDRALRISGDPTLTTYGQLEDDLAGDGTPKPVKIGAESALRFADKESGHAEWLVPKIDSLQEMREDLAGIESRMQNAAVSLEQKTETLKTATQINIENSDKVSKLQLWSISLQNALNDAMAYAMAYLGKEATGQIIVNNDFDDNRLTEQQLKALSEMELKGQISLETMLELMKAGEWFGQKFDIEDEIKKIGERSPM